MRECTSVVLSPPVCGVLFQQPRKLIYRVSKDQSMLGFIGHGEILLTVYQGHAQRCWHVTLAIPRGACFPRRVAFQRVTLLTDPFCKHCAPLVPPVSRTKSCCGQQKGPRLAFGARLANYVPWAKSNPTACFCKFLKNEKSFT